MDTVVSAMRCLPASSERRTASAATKGRSTSLSVWTVGCKRGSAAGVLAESWTDVLPDLRTEDNQRITNPDLRSPKTSAHGFQCLDDFSRPLRHFVIAQSPV